MRLSGSLLQIKSVLFGLHELVYELIYVEREEFVYRVLMLVHSWNSSYQVTVTDQWYYYTLMFTLNSDKK